MLHKSSAAVVTPLRRCDFFRGALTQPRIRILPVPGIETAGETAAPYAFPFEGKVSAEPTDEVFLEAH